MCKCLYKLRLYKHSTCQRGFTLEFTKTGEIFVVGPSQYPSLVDVVHKLMEHPQMKEKREKWVNCEKKEKFSGLTAFTRSMTGHVDPKGKRVITFMGWRILGIFLS